MNVPALQGSTTFRDPAGSLRIEGKEVLRTVHPEYAPDALRFLRSEIAERLTREGRMVSSRILSSGEEEPLLLKHPHVFFPSYPWEWTPGQWIAAGELTLDLCSEMLGEGWILKDATPLNILFEGCRPVFVDVLSAERRDPQSPLWLAYGQFARTFLLPLAAFKYLGWPLAATMTRRDGYEPADLYPYLSPLERWRRPLRSLVTIPHLLEKKRPGGARPPQLRQRPEIATAVLKRNLASMRRALLALQTEARDSRWSDYPDRAEHYGSEDQQRKHSFVGRVMVSLHPESVLDIGANTGQYSRIAANSGAQVVAWDADVGACERNWSEAKQKGLAIQPMVVNAARPTPAAGWWNGESLSLLERARGRFDCVLLLGILHHLLVSEQIPLESIAKLAAAITRRWAIVEWVPKTDVRFIEICRGRDDLYRSLEESLFLTCFAEHFLLVEREVLNNGRVLFLFEKL